MQDPDGQHRADEPGRARSARIGAALLGQRSGQDVRCRALLRRRSTAKSRWDEARRVEVNDRVIGAQLAIVADPTGNRLGTVLMLRDVTRDALADRLKDQFVTQMSHELRTPLTTYQGYERSHARSCRKIARRIANFWKRSAAMWLCWIA